MKVRVENLLGKDAHEASFIEMDDEINEGQKKTVLEVRAAGRDPMRMDWASIDEAVVVEATPDEEAKIAAMRAEAAKYAD